MVWEKKSQKTKTTIFKILPWAKPTQNRTSVQGWPLGFKARRKNIVSSTYFRPLSMSYPKLASTEKLSSTFSICSAYYRFQDAFTLKSSVDSPSNSEIRRVRMSSILTMRKLRPRQRKSLSYHRSRDQNKTKISGLSKLEKKVPLPFCLLAPPPLLVKSPRRATTVGILSF